MAIFNQQHFRFIALVAVLLLPCRLFAEVLVVSGVNSPPITVSKNQIRDLFTGKASLLPGISAVIPIDQPESSPLREEFYLRVANKSVAQVKASWAKLYFTGRGVPPREAADSNKVKIMVNSIPGAIGYIEKSSLDNSVRVIFDAQ